MASRDRGDFYFYGNRRITSIEEPQDTFEQFSEAVVLLQSDSFRDHIRGSYLMGELISIARKNGLDYNAESELWSIINGYNKEVAALTLSAEEAITRIIVDVDELLSMSGMN